MYLRRRQWLRQIVGNGICHIACWFRSGAGLNTESMTKIWWSQSLWQKIWLCSVTSAKTSFLWYNFLFEQTNHIRTAVHRHPQLSLKCRLPNRISVDVFDWCFCKVETRACETLRSCAKRLGGLEVTTLPGASCSFNPALRTAGLASGVGDGGVEGASARPKVLIWWKSGENLWKVGQNVWKPSQNRFMCFDFTNMVPEMKMHTVSFFYFGDHDFFHFCRAS